MMKGHHLQRGGPELPAGQGIRVIQPGRGGAPTLRDCANGQVFLEAQPKQLDALDSLRAALAAWCRCGWAASAMTACTQVRSNKPRQTLLVCRDLRDFCGYLRGRERAALVVHEREQVGGGVAVAGRGGFEEASHAGHSDECIGYWWKNNGRWQ
jgi:hypothetical protein